MFSLLPAKLKGFEKKLGDSAFTILDVGAGNHSASVIKKHFPGCRYFGIDITKDYNNDENDFSKMEGFWEKDLTQLEFADIPDDFFNEILMNHIIEHLHNGDAVIKALLNKLKKGGYIYIEYPSGKSVNFPSKKGTLNFYDDPTHVRIYSVAELSGIMKPLGMEILSSGVRKDWRNIAMMPMKIIHNKLKYGFVYGSVFWDWYGFAEFIWARKK